MKRIGILTLFGLLCFGWAAVAQDVTYNFDQGADFSKYRTYKWIEIKGGVELDQILDQQVKTAFDAELVKKGLRKTNDDKADLYVGYQLALRQEKQVSSFTTGGAGWGYPPRWGGGMSTTTATTSTITVGTMLLDVYDPAGRHLLWRGRATKTVDEKAKPEKRQQLLNKGAQKMLKYYPPPVKK